MRARLLRTTLAALLGTAAALLVACGSSGKGLIPASAGQPLQSDIEAVDQAAQEGNGNCQKTEAALVKTDQDFQHLPASLNSGLHNELKLGIENLHKVATEACLQQLANTTSTAAPKTTTVPPTTTSTPTTTPTTTTPSTSTTQATSPPTEHVETPEGAGPGGGTAAPGEGAGKGNGEGGGAAEGKGDGHGNGNGGKESGN